VGDALDGVHEGAGAVVGGVQLVLLARAVVRGQVAAERRGAGADSRPLLSSTSAAHFSAQPQLLLVTEAAGMVP
jgi:hypothetical protein